MRGKKVLIISYIWPPMEGVGLIRALKFAKYLPEYGWEPMILTVRAPDKDKADVRLSDNIKVFRTEYKDVIGNAKNTLGNLRFWRRKNINPDLPAVSTEKKYGKKNSLTSVVRELIAIPDEQVGWYDFAVEDGNKIIKDHRVDIIFSTSPPETAHLIARALKKRWALPWVADLRDLWAEDHYRARPLLKKTLLRSMERKVLKDADTLITVSEPWARTLRSSMPGKMIKVIENGFDEEDFKGVSYNGNRKFTISYTGKLHKDHQSIEVFFKALSGLIKEGYIDKERIEVKFYVLGYDRPDISGLTGQYGLKGIVREPGKVSYMKSLEAQKASDMLLFIQWSGNGSDGWYSAKLYDYIGARRPIIALAEKDGIIAELIEETSSGMAVDGEYAMREAIVKLYDEHARNGSVRYDGNNKIISKHTRRLRTQELAGLFDSLIKK